MRTRKARLPETDTARVALLPETDQLRLLRQMKGGFAPFSYRPTRTHLPDTAIIRLGSLPMTVEDMEREKLLSLVTKSCGSDVEIAANCEVSGLIYDWVRAGNVEVFSEDFGRLVLASGYSVTFWMNAIFREGDRLMVINPDFRRSTGYSPAGRLFAFSAMHERIRSLGGDYADLDLILMTFPADREGKRHIRLRSAAELELLPYETLVAKTEQTLLLWDQVCEERAAKAQGEAANDPGPLFRDKSASGG